MSGNKQLKYVIEGIQDITRAGIGGPKEFYAAVNEVFDYAKESDYTCISTKIDKENGSVSIELKGENSEVSDIYRKMCDITDNMDRGDCEIDSDFKDIVS